MQGCRIQADLPRRQLYYHRMALPGCLLRHSRPGQEPQTALRAVALGCGLFKAGYELGIWIV